MSRLQRSRQLPHECYSVSRWGRIVSGPAGTGTASWIAWWDPHCQCHSGVQCFSVEAAVFWFIYTKTTAYLGVVVTGFPLPVLSRFQVSLGKRGEYLAQQGRRVLPWMLIVSGVLDPSFFLVPMGVPAIVRTTIPSCKGGMCLFELLVVSRLRAGPGLPCCVEWCLRILCCYLFLQSWCPPPGHLLLSAFQISLWVLSYIVSKVYSCTRYRGIRYMEKQGICPRYTGGKTGRDESLHILSGLPIALLIYVKLPSTLWPF